MTHASRPPKSATVTRASAALIGGVALAAAACTTSRKPVATPIDELPVELWSVGISSASPERGPGRVDQFADADPSALTDFREALSPFGAWADDATYGTVWVPDLAVVGPGFVPYVTGGRWGLNEAEAHVWLSEHDETFGWVVFRYGRWAQSGERWVWVPGRTYAPAWVAWKAGVPGEQPYVAWGPAPPSFVWRRGVAVRLEPQAPQVMVACAASDLFSPDLDAKLLPAEQGAAVASSLVDFDARMPDGLARQRPFVASAVGLPMRGPSYSTGHVPFEAWPAERYSRAGTPNSHYATPAAMGRLGPSGEPARLASASSAPGSTLKTFAAGGALVRSQSRSMRSAYLHVPTYGGSSAKASVEPQPAFEDTAVAPTSTELVPIVFPRSQAAKKTR